MDTSQGRSATMRRDRTLLRLAALVLAVVAACLATPSGAYAAEGSLCTDGGVNVVVDYQDLGGGVVQACDEKGAGKLASEVFEESGFELTPVAAFPGAACQVDDKPADASCAKMPPADAYWGLYLAQDGKWGYAPKGANELKLAEGDFVAFSWQGSKTSTPPGVAPVRPAADATGSDSGSSPAADEEEEDSSSVAWWVPVLVVVLLGAAGVVIAMRRRTDRS